MLPVSIITAGLLAWSCSSIIAAEKEAAPDKPKTEEAKPADAQPDVVEPCTTAKPKTSVWKREPEKFEKRIWANSLLYCDAPKLDVEKWLTDKPEMDDKFILIEFWRTWCGACKRSVPLLNGFHEKFGKELIVIAITGEPEETVKAYSGPKMNYFMAIDAPGKKKDDAQDKVKDQGAIEEAFGVFGWPHVVLLEPEYRSVVWEGFPLLKGHELTEKELERILAIGRGGKTKK